MLLKYFIGFVTSVYQRKIPSTSGSRRDILVRLVDKYLINRYNRVAFHTTCPVRHIQQYSSSDGTWGLVVGRAYLESALTYRNNNDFRTRNKTRTYSYYIEMVLIIDVMDAFVFGILLIVRAIEVYSRMI